MIARCPDFFIERVENLDQVVIVELVFDCWWQTTLAQNGNPEDRMETSGPAARKASTSPPSEMVVEPSPGKDKALALTNRAYCSPKDARSFSSSGSSEGMVRVNNEIVLTVTYPFDFDQISELNREVFKKFLVYGT
jgi:hypothetical protein